MRFMRDRILAVLKGRSLGATVLAGALLVAPPITAPIPCPSSSAPEMARLMASGEHAAPAAVPTPAHVHPATMACCATVTGVSSAAAVESSFAAGSAAPAAAPPLAAPILVAFTPVPGLARQVRLPWPSYYERSRRILQ